MAIGPLLIRIILRNSHISLGFLPFPKKGPGKRTVIDKALLAGSVFVSEGRAVVGHFTKRGFHQDGVCP